MFFCECLNIIGEFNDVHNKLATSTSVKINPIQASNDSSYYELIDFFKLALGPICSNETKISIQHAAFICKMKMERWTVSKCLNCDCYVFAVADSGISNSSEVLINGKMLRDKNLLLESIKSENYSMPFKIILKPMDLLSIKNKSAINDDLQVKQLFSKLQDYITHDEKETEAEIRRLTLAMAKRRQQAEKDYELIVTLINSIQSNEYNEYSINNSTLQSTTTNMSTENIQSFSITPPVTPESAQMTIDQAPFSKMMSNNHREGISKHNNAILQKQSTRAIEFEDDIFELDGMVKDERETMDEHDRYHKYSDTEEDSGSDNEEMMLEKRLQMRGRSGSLAIARSAPISVPQFLNNANPHPEEKPQKNDLDIAGSIKHLAKSIHADSIFGELPSNRHAFKYDTEF